MLDANIRNQLSGYLGRLQRPIELVASLDGGAKSAEVSALLREIAALSPLVAVREDGADARRPSFSVGLPGEAPRVRFAGVPLGQHEWAAVQFGVGVFLWPVVMALILVRIGVHGLWPERLLPTAFITVAPSALIGLSLLRFEAAPVWAQGCWGISLFFLLWSAQVLKPMLAQPFSMAWWALSFPLAAFAALTLKLAQTGQPFAFLAVPVLALATLVIAALCLWTIRGLQQGTLLVPEP